MTGGEQRTLVVGAAVLSDGLVLAARRRRPAGAWEFPGGKCYPGEDAVAALRRELHEELAVDIEVGDEVLPDAGGTWPINSELHLRVWLAQPLGVPSAGPDHDQLIWLRPADLGTLAWLPADVPVAAKVTELLGGT